jgi:hypothetical protein
MKLVVLFLAVSLTACASAPMPKPIQPEVCFMNRQGRIVHAMKVLDFGIVYQHGNDPVLEYMRWRPFGRHYKHSDCPSAIAGN